MNEILKIKNRAASSGVYNFLRDCISSFPPKAKWQQKRQSKLRQVLDSGNDGFWIDPDQQKGRARWRSTGAICLNRHPIELPWWWYRDFTFPALSLIKLNRPIAFRDDGIPPKSEMIRMPDDWSPDYGDVWSSDHYWIKECSRSGQNGPCVKATDVSDIKELATVQKGRCFYLGWLSKNYGHFLLESMSCLWPLVTTKLDTTNMRFVAFPMEYDLNLEKAPRFLSLTFQQLGIELPEIYLIRKPVIFEQLFVPTPSFHLPGAYGAPAQSKVWSAIQESNQDLAENTGSGRKLYLSRRKYEIARNRQRRPLANERDVENLFREYGFEIIYPETISFTEQLRLYGQSSIIAGLAGSNMHNSAFMPRGSKVIVLAPKSFVVQADHLINATKGIQTYYYFADVSNVHYDSQQSWHINTEVLRECLNNHNLLKGTK